MKFFVSKMKKFGFSNKLKDPETLLCLKKKYTRFITRKEFNLITVNVFNKNVNYVNLRF